MIPALKILPDSESLAQAAAEHFVALADEAVSERGRFAVALSGGSTPKLAYAHLASPQFARRVAWESVHIFWGDERCVPPDHTKSNYGMARKALLDWVPVPSHQVHRMRGEADPVQAATEYEETLREFFNAGPQGRTGPRFDLVLLGMGEDGHAASLFPGSKALHESRRWVAAEAVEPQGDWRLTLTPRALNAARQVTFLVSGREKAATLREVLEGASQPERLPAQAIRPDPGRLLWLVDAEASALLTPTPISGPRRGPS